MCACVCVCLRVCVCVQCALDSPHRAGVHADLSVEVAREEVHNLDRANGIACREGRPISGQHQQARLARSASAGS